MIDGQNIFDQPVKNDLIAYVSIQIIPTVQRDDYTTVFLLDYSYFKNCYKMIAIYLSKQQALDVDPKVIQQINFNGNLENNATTFFTVEKVKETVLGFSQGILKVFCFFLFCFVLFLFCFNIVI